MFVLEISLSKSCFLAGVTDVTELIHSLVKVLVVCVIIVACFWFFKNRTRASIEQGDKSMSVTSFPEGSYTVNTAITSLSALKTGDYVAYRIPTDASNLHIARVIGIEGNRVEVTPKEVRVNGAPYDLRFPTTTWTIPETKVPRGCAFLLTDDPTAGVDSKQLGPIPFAAIAGTIQPAR